MKLIEILTIGGIIGVLITGFFYWLDSQPPVVALDTEECSLDKPLPSKSILTFNNIKNKTERAKRSFEIKEETLTELKKINKNLARINRSLTSR